MDGMVLINMCHLSFALSGFYGLLNSSKAETAYCSSQQQVKQGNMLANQL
tara:strand:- start:213 stop:362 length:150 start_codon:yes stop_codon:yes gene_type:complete